MPRHPTAIAWDEFAKHNRYLFDLFTTGMDPQCLENRLRLAFQAGWDAREAPRQSNVSLTPAETRVFEVIRSSLTTRGMAPTRAEIAVACGYRSNNAAEEHLRSLARKGAIRLTAGIARGITLPV
jgi:hypothetical protein